MFAKINLKEYLELKHVWNRRITSRSTSSCYVAGLLTCPALHLLNCLLGQYHDVVCSLCSENVNQYLEDATTFPASQELTVRSLCICRRVPGWMRKLLDLLPDHFENQ